MAIFWVDPTSLSTTTSTGTYADPLSFYMSDWTSAGVADSDEIRIKGYYVSDMISGSSTYNGTITNTYSSTESERIYCTDTTGLAAGDFIYTDQGLFGSIDNVSTDTYIDFDYIQSRPVKDLVAAATSVQFWKVDHTYYSTANTSTLHIVPRQGLSNLTISDGWIDETTRVTDGTVKTLITNDFTSAKYIYIGAEDSTYNLQNSAFVGKDGSDTNFKIVDDVTLNVGQLFIGGSYAYGIDVRDSTYTCHNLTLNADVVGSNYHICLRSSSYNNHNFQKINMNIGYSIAQYNKYQLPSTFGDITIDYAISYAEDAPAIIEAREVSGYTGTITINEEVRTLDSTPASYLVEGNTHLNVTLGANFKYYYNTNTEQSSVTGAYYNTYTGVNYDGNGPQMPYQAHGFGVITNNSTLSIPTLISKTPLAVDYSEKMSTFDRKQKQARPIYSRVNINAADTGKIYSSMIGPMTSLISYNDMDVKIITRPTTGYSDTYTKGIWVVENEVDYKNTAPSLSHALMTFDSTYNHYIFEVLEVPVAGDGETQFTISGWVKCTANAVQDMILTVVYDSIEYEETVINIANAESDWVQFSIPITPSRKQIVGLNCETNLLSSGILFLFSDIGIS